MEWWVALALGLHYSSEHIHVSHLEILCGGVAGYVGTLSELTMAILQENVRMGSREQHLGGRKGQHTG